MTTEGPKPPKPATPPVEEQDFSDVDGFAPGDRTDPDLVPMDIQHVPTDSIENALRSALPKE